MTGLHGISDRRIVADDLETDHSGQLRNDGVDFPGHDRRTGLQAGKIDFRKAGIRSRAKEPDVVRNADGFESNSAQCCAHISHAGVGLHRPAHVVRRRQLLTCDAGQIGNGLYPVVGMGVDSRAHGASTQPQLSQRSGGKLQELLPLDVRDAVGGKFLPEAHRNRILHVGAAGLHDVVKGLRFFRECRRQVLEHRVQLVQRQQRGQPHRGREDIVGGLPVIHMVVGMKVGVFAQFPAQDFVGAIGDHFIGIHMQAYPCARLKNIDHEFRVPFAIDHFLGSLDNGVGALRIHQAEFLVGLRGGTLDHAQGADKRRMSAHPGDGEIVHRARCLRTVIGLGGHLDKTKRIFFFAEIRHEDVAPE